MEAFPTTSTQRRDRPPPSSDARESSESAPRAQEGPHPMRKGRHAQAPEVTRDLARHLHRFAKQGRRHAHSAQRRRCPTTRRRTPRRSRAALPGGLARRRTPVVGRRASHPLHRPITTVLVPRRSRCIRRPEPLGARGRPALAGRQSPIPRFPIRARGVTDRASPARSPASSHRGRARSRPVGPPSTSAW